MAAVSADQMVMIVADPTFVERRGSNGLDAPYTSLFDEQAQGVINRLARNCADFGAGGIADGIGSAMWVGIDGLHHGDALWSDVDPEVAKGGREVSGHGFNRHRIDRSVELVISPNFAWKEDTDDVASQFQNVNVGMSTSKCQRQNVNVRMPTSERQCQNREVPMSDDFPCVARA